MDTDPTMDASEMGEAADNHTLTVPTKNDPNNLDVKEEHRTRITVGSDTENGQVNLAFESEPPDHDNPINENFYNSEQHAQTLQSAMNGNGIPPTEINIPSDSVINMHNGRIRNKNKKSSKEKDVEKIPLEPMDETYPYQNDHDQTQTDFSNTDNEMSDKNQNSNGYKNNTVPVSSESLTQNKQEASLGKPFQEYFIPVTTHKKLLRGEKLYLQRYTGKSPGWKKCIICGVIATFLALAILIAILLTTGVIAFNSDDKQTESPRNRTGVQPVASVDRSANGVVIPVETVTEPPKVTLEPSLVYSTEDDNRILSETTTSTPFYRETTEQLAESSPTSEGNAIPQVPGQTQTLVDDEPRAVSGEIRLTSLEFNNVLSDNTSDEYMNLAKSVQSEIINALSNNSSKIKEVKIVGFSPGSVNVHYVIIYEDDSQPDQELPQKTARALNEYINEKGGTVAGYAVDMESIKLKTVSNECLDNNGYCTHICEWDAEKLERTCSCNHGYTLLHDGMTCTEEQSGTTVVNYGGDSFSNSEPGATPATEPSVEPEAHFYNATVAEPTSEPEPSLYDDTAIAPEPTSEPEPTSYNDTTVAPERSLYNNTSVAPERISEPEPSVYNDTVVVPEATSEPEPSLYNDTTVVPQPTSEPEPSVYNDTTVLPQPTSEPEPSVYNDTIVAPETTIEPEPSSYNDTTVVPQPTSEPEPSLYNGTIVAPEPTIEPEPSSYNDTTVVPQPTSEPEPSLYNATTFAPEPTSEPEPSSYNDTNVVPQPTSEPEPSSYNDTNVVPQPTSEPEPSLYNGTIVAPKPTSEPEPSSYNDTIVVFEPTSVPEPSSHNDTAAVPQPTSDPEPSLYNGTVVAPEPTSEPEPNLYNDTIVVPEPTGEPEPGPYNDTNVVPQPTSEPEPSLYNDTIVSPEPTSEPEPSLYNDTLVLEPTSVPEPSSYNDTIVVLEPTSVPEPSLYNDTLVVLEPTSVPEPSSYNDTTVAPQPTGELEPSLYNGAIVAPEPTSEPEPSLYNDTLVLEPTSVPEPSSYNDTTAVPQPTSEPEPSLYNGTIVAPEPTSEPEPSLYNDTTGALEPSSYNDTTVVPEPEPSLYNDTTFAPEPTSEPEPSLYNHTAAAPEPEHSSLNNTTVVLEPSLYNDTTVAPEPTSEPEPKSHNDTTHVVANSTIELESKYNATTVALEPTTQPNPFNVTTEVPESTSEPDVEIAPELTSYNYNNFASSESESTMYNVTTEQVSLSEPQPPGYNDTISKPSGSSATGKESFSNIIYHAVDKEAMCRKDQFACSKYGSRNISCIPFEAKCDGVTDCEDGSDEKACGNCSAGNFPCKDGSYCLTPAEICDSKLKCSDNSDEKNCIQPAQCEQEGGFYCSSGLCLPAALRCDGLFDCSTGEDESSCSCAFNQFQCSNRQCILWEKKCDGRIDCTDESDESDCVFIEKRTSLVKIFKPQTGWLPLCSADWTIDDGNYVCRQLGYSSAKRVGAEVLPHDDEWAVKWESGSFKSPVHTSVLPETSCESTVGATLQCNIDSCNVEAAQSFSPNWSFLVSLTNSVDGSSCDGVILSSMWAITTKTCLDNRNWDSNSPWIVRAGSGAIEQRKIDRFIFNPGSNSWRSRGLIQDSDVVLAKLQSPLYLNESVHAPCLMLDEILPTDQCYSAHLTQEHTVSAFEMKLLDQKICNGPNYFNGRITDRMICASTNVHHGNQCEKGKVAPLVCKSRGKWKLGGLLSYERYCDTFNPYPSVFSNLSKMTKFLKEVLGSSVNFEKENLPEENDIGVKPIDEDAKSSTSTSEPSTVNLIVDQFGSDTNDINHARGENDITEAEQQDTKPEIDVVYNDLENSLNAISKMIKDSEGRSVDKIDIILENTTDHMIHESSNHSNLTATPVELQGYFPGQFKCEASLTYIDDRFLCNGIEDCEDSSDERFCLRLHPEAGVLEARVSGHSINEDAHSSNTWVPVCADGWNDDFSRAACIQMGFSGELVTESDSSISLKEGKPEQKFMALVPEANVSSPLNLQTLLRQTDQCKSGNYSRLTCQTERCGAWSLDLQPVGRTFGGNPAQDGQWPSVAIIRSQVDESVVCTASILSKRWAVTAASCLQKINVNPKSWKFQAGLNDPEVAIGKILIHPNMKAGDLVQNDVAMVQLAEPISVNSQAHSICYANIPLEDRQLCVTASWNINSDSGELVLKYLPVPVVRMSECNDSKFYDGYMSEDMVCAGFTDRPRATCEGDEGAPLMCINRSELWVLHGTLLKDNVRQECGSTSFPSVYTNIYEHQSWISQILSYTNINSSS